MQLIALGELRDLTEARQHVAELKSVQRYEPRHLSEWVVAFDWYEAL